MHLQSVVRRRSLPIRAASLHSRAQCEAHTRPLATTVDDIQRCFALHFSRFPARILDLPCPKSTLFFAPCTVLSLFHGFSLVLLPSPSVLLFFVFSSSSLVAAACLMLFPPTVREKKKTASLAADRGIHF